MGRDRAAYMREYRKRDRCGLPTVAQLADAYVAELNGRIAELEEEVRHLKAELAKRPPLPDIRSFNSRPFTPVPKK